MVAAVAPEPDSPDHVRTVKALRVDDDQLDAAHSAERRGDLKEAVVLFSGILAPGRLAAAVQLDATCALLRGAMARNDVWKVGGIGRAEASHASS